MPESESMQKSWRFQRARKHRREFFVRWNGLDESLSWETRYGIQNKTMVDDLDKQWDYAEKLKE